MNDLIKRSDAIRLAEQGQIQGFEWQFKKLCELPSAEPERAIKDCRNCKHGNYNDHWDTYFCYHSDDCNDWDKWEPSAQTERKKGTWIDTGSGQECSKCHEIQHGYDNFRYFCAFCGADMRVGEEE